MNRTGGALSEWAVCGGCAAKWGPGPLGELVASLAATGASPLLVGLAPSDDAAVYAIDTEVALVATTDFFPPVVGDPTDFGAIAAANACSDVFAMGGRVVLALNIAAFPEGTSNEVISAVFAGAAGVVSEAGGTVAGGHTIRAAEPIFGLAVQGLVHPERVWTKGGARPGDVLVLSKPLGTGIVLSAGDEEERSLVVEGMRRLNAHAAAVLSTGDAPSAVTDVTGFGLLGHGWEIAERSEVVLHFAADALPLYPGARRLAIEGVRTGGDARNRSHLDGHVQTRTSAAMEAVAYDPQTSGGLLAAVAPVRAEEVCATGVFVRVGTVGAGAPAVTLT